MKIVRALRGAVCCENTKESITENVCKMFNEIVIQNNLTAADIISVQFSLTKDLTVLNPATALRKGDVRIDVSELALFCSQEAFIEGGMPYVVRVLIHTYMDQFANRKNIYLNGAEKLRPDFSK
ncbi:MAG: chorismate mutase [Treponema sp.]|nr:chorismate mutase [Treponema sp.]